MDWRLAWVGAAAVGVAVAVAVVRVRRRVGPRPEGLVMPPASPTEAIARTRFVEGGGYVQIGGIVQWASADPATRILSGQALHYRPGGDGHTVTVVPAETSAPEGPRR